MLRGQPGATRAGDVKDAHVCFRIVGRYPSPEALALIVQGRDDELLQYAQTDENVRDGLDSATADSPWRVLSALWAMTKPTSASNHRWLRVTLEKLIRQLGHRRGSSVTSSQRLPR